MQHHDQVAELRGLHTERANYRAAGRTDRAEQVDHQIAGVTAAITDRIEQLRQRAEISTAQGADVRAGPALEEARELQAVLDELAPPDEQDEPEEPTVPEQPEQEAVVEAPAARTTQESTPRETATTRKTAAKGKES
jgi:hypothetical protein